MNQTPVAYIVFNRPQHTENSFAVLRRQRPKKLFIIADGPRPSNPSDIARCSAVREIIENVDWPCEVRRNYAEINLGLKRRVSSGLDWVFEQVDRAIILEDDCVAHPDFFNFCDQLLDRYAGNDRISVITGNNFQDGRKRGDASYYFSKYNHCWGWATWRRAWKHYQGDLPFWSAWKHSDGWKAVCPDKVERLYWVKIFDQVYADGIDSWAYPWTACVWKHGGLTVTPNVNLVTNIGFGVDATHTCDSNGHQANMPVSALPVIVHPAVAVQDSVADRYVFDHHFGGRWLSWPWRWIRLLARALKRLKRCMESILSFF